jgi:uncharacterized protein
MSVELRPLGVKCNLGCAYCYQNPQRDAGNIASRYDLEVMKRAVLEEGGPFTLFGGEPLLMPLGDLEELWRFGLEHFGGSAVQTNGTLITERHIEQFARYRVDVGISVDGPEALNDVRAAGSPGATRAATARTMAAIARLCGVGRPPSLIVTLHRGNGVGERLEILVEWLREIDRLGVTAARIHLLEVDSPEVAAHLALSTDEHITALLRLARLEEELPTLRFDVFRELDALLLADDEGTTCVWRACDPGTTPAVRGIEGFGQRSNCGRTNKDGVDMVKADHPSHMRQLALYHTPQEHGGCAGCRFFLACKGQCPGTGIDGDWRNRTASCAEWKVLFRRSEERLLDAGHFPISAQPNRGSLEREMLAAWTRGENPTLRQALAAMHEAAGRATTTGDGR